MPLWHGQISSLHDAPRQQAYYRQWDCHRCGLYPILNAPIPLQPADLATVTISVHSFPPDFLTCALKSADLRGLGSA